MTCSKHGLVFLLALVAIGGCWTSQPPNKVYAFTKDNRWLDQGCEFELSTLTDRPFVLNKADVIEIRKHAENSFAKDINAEMAAHQNKPLAFVKVFKCYPSGKKRVLGYIYFDANDLTSPRYNSGMAAAIRQAIARHRAANRP